jgi:hypothetical protein
MSHLESGDEELHHVDNSHRWTGGPGDDDGDARWLARMRAHQLAHRILVGHEEGIAKPRVPWSH